MIVNAEPKRLLIVDDESTILCTLSYALRSDGVEVMTASRMEPAEEALSRYAFDVVIVDIRMSGFLGIEGLELLSYIKRYWPKTEVIAMTAFGSKEIKRPMNGEPDITVTNRSTSANWPGWCETSVSL